MLRRAKALFHRLLAAVAVMGLMSPLAGAAEGGERWEVNMTQGVTPISQEIYGLHMLIFWVCVVIGIGVFIAMVYTILMHRKSRGYEASQFHEHLGLEIAWTLVPFIILIAMAVPSTTALVRIYDHNTDVDLDVLVTGYQWKWKYEYVGKDVSFFSNLHPEHNEARKLDSGVDVWTIDNYLLEVDQELVVPINKKIRFLLTANDVIHAWWVPELGVKKDAIPGFVNETWAYIEEPGIYRGQCAELCGKDHGFMPVVVRAVEEAEYEAWIGEQQAKAAEIKELAGQTFTFDELYAQGEAVYGRACATCHGPTGEGVPGAFPAIKGSPVATGPLQGHIDILLKGVSGTAMQSFAEQLNPVEIASVITYQRNSWGNNMGDSVQPIEILQAQE